MNADQRIAAQLEEIIVKPNAFDAKQFLPDSGDGLLDLISGCNIRVSLIELGLLRPLVNDSW